MKFIGSFLLCMLAGWLAFNVIRRTFGYDVRVSHRGDSTQTLADTHTCHTRQYYLYPAITGHVYRPTVSRNVFRGNG